QIFAAAVRAYRQATADDFSERRNVRPNIIEFLRAASSHTEACHHFIKNQQGIVSSSYFPDCLQVSGLGWDAAHVADDWLNNHRSYVLMLIEDRFESLLVIERSGEGVLSQRGRHAGTIGQAQRGDT